MTEQEAGARRFAREFKRLLDARGLSKTQAADMMGTSPSYVSQISKGKPVGASTVESVANMLSASDEERRSLHVAAATDAGFRIDLPDDF